MTDTDARVPAGWYPDPLGLPQLRWWDNQAWTEHTSEARQPMVAQETIVQPGPRLGFADDLPRFADPTDEAPAGVTRTPSAAAATAEALLEIEAPAGRTLVASDRAPEAGVAAFPAPDPSAPEIDFAGPEPAAAGAPTATATATAVAEEPASASVSTASAAGGTAVAGRFDDLLVEDRPLTIPEWDEPRLRASSDAESAAPRAFSLPLDFPASMPGTVSVTAAVSAEPRRDRTMTVQSWIIALSPLTFIVVSLFLLTSGALDVSGATVVALSLAIPYLGCIPLAVGDWIVNRRRGLEPPHWLWIMGTSLVYLIVRSVVLTRRTGRGFGPLLGLVGSVLTVFVALVLVPGIVIGVNPLGFSHSIEQSVEDQAAVFGVKLDVTCPPNPPTVIGDSFTCLAHERNDSVDGFDVRVSLQRANGWIAWHVDSWGQLSSAHRAMKTTR